MRDDEDKVNEGEAQVGVGPGQNSNNDRLIDDRLRRTTIGVGHNTRS